MSEPLSEAAKQAQREYYKKWRDANKDKIRENNRRYWERKGNGASKPKQEPPAQADGIYRLNLKLDGGLREYLAYEAWRNRVSITALVNKILLEYRDAHDLSRLFQEYTEKEGDYL